MLWWLPQCSVGVLSHQTQNQGGPAFIRHGRASERWRNLADFSNHIRTLGYRRDAPGCNGGVQPVPELTRSADIKLNWQAYRRDSVARFHQATNRFRCIIRNLYRLLAKEH